MSSATSVLSAIAKVVLAAKKVPAMPLPPGPLEKFRDMLLFQGDFTWMYWVTLAGFIAANLKKVHTDFPNVNFSHGVVLGLLMSYGGSTFTAIICSKPVPFLSNESLVLMYLSVYCVMHFFKKPIMSFLNTSVGKLLNSTCYEIFRSHVMMNCAAMAAAAGSTFTSKWYPVPIVAPLICGVLGGCGGGFMPLDKGLSPITSGVDNNWRILSSLVGSIWLQLSMRDPTTKEIIGISEPWARFYAVTFFVFLPMLQVAFPGFNPLGENPLVGSPSKKKIS